MSEYARATNTGTSGDGVGIAQDKLGGVRRTIDIVINLFVINLIIQVIITHSMETFQQNDNNDCLVSRIGGKTNISQAELAILTKNCLKTVQN